MDEFQRVYCVVHDITIDVAIDDDHWYVPSDCGKVLWPLNLCAMQFESRGGLHTVIQERQRLIEAGPGRRP
jgi:hypothetical protein